MKTFVFGNQIFFFCGTPFLIGCGCVGLALISLRAFKVGSCGNFVPVLELLDKRVVGMFI